jgi:hypothetical protein
VVLVDEATEDRFASNPSFVEAGGGRYRRRGGVGRALVQALVGTMPVVTRRVLAKDSPRVTRSYNQDPVGQFAVQCPGEALADRIRPRCAWWRVDDLAGVGFEHPRRTSWCISCPGP